MKQFISSRSPQRQSVSERGEPPCNSPGESVAPTHCSSRKQEETFWSRGFGSWWPTDATGSEYNVKVKELVVFAWNVPFHWRFSSSTGIRMQWPTIMRHPCMCFFKECAIRRAVGFCASAGPGQRGIYVFFESWIFSVRPTQLFALQPNPVTFPAPCPSKLRAGPRTQTKLRTTVVLLTLQTNHTNCFDTYPCGVRTYWTQSPWWCTSTSRRASGGGERLKSVTNPWVGPRRKRDR